jgi:hypothetical protein
LSSASRAVLIKGQTFVGDLGIEALLRELLPVPDAREE